MVHDLPGVGRAPARPPATSCSSLDAPKAAETDRRLGRRRRGALMGGVQEWRSTAQRHADDATSPRPAASSRSRADETRARPAAALRHRQARSTTAGARCHRPRLVAATSACCGPGAAAARRWPAPTRWCAPRIDPAFLSDRDDVDAARRAASSSLRRILRQPALSAAGARTCAATGRPTTERRADRALHPRQRRHRSTTRSAAAGWGRGPATSSTHDCASRACSGTARGRRVDHAEHRVRQHQRADDHDRRARRPT
ncbi:MAG: hypothetical protein MZW92_22490 [Comamonadaceae bacterium]|nr:hypothetical protein [Comamonadaceae bacterium]